MSVQFVSLISRNDKPLYIQSFEDIGANTAADANRFLKYNFLSHMALDIFSSTALLSLREQQQQADDDSGVLLLFIQDDTTVYGFETNNGLRIVIGFGVYEINQVKGLFSLVYKCYLRTIFNPFATEDEEKTLQNATFDEGIKGIVSAVTVL